jgi:hypothetical protein
MDMITTYVAEFAMYSMFYAIAFCDNASQENSQGLWRRPKYVHICILYGVSPISLLAIIQIYWK